MPPVEFKWSDNRVRLASFLMALVYGLQIYNIADKYKKASSKEKKFYDAEMTISAVLVVIGLACLYAPNLFRHQILFYLTIALILVNVVIGFARERK